MPSLEPRYQFKETEEKWLKVYEQTNAFHAKPDQAKSSYTVVIPPPNVTGILHMGHALNNTLQDIMIRYQRMRGAEALWMPGTDHAGIATQNVVEKELAKEGKKRQDLGRELFLERLWAWKKQYGDTIIHQLEKLGSSCDWPRTRFTMDEAYSEAVKEVFIRLYKDGLIYQGQYIINWCPRCQTALSDEEAEHKEKNGKLYYIRYPFKNNPNEGIIVATTRPETYLGDSAVAVNPQDERYRALIGQSVILPLINREIKIIADDFVAAEFGTGAVKVTPAHDPNDFGMGRRHNLEFINVMHPDGRMNERAGEFKNLDRFEARKLIVASLEEQGYLLKIEDHKHAVGHCYRCDTVVEPYLSKQWFVKMAPLAKPALEAVKNGTITILPERYEKVYINWLENIKDWCISRQIWWGHRVPVWYDQDENAYVGHNLEEAQQLARQKHGRDVQLRQDEDVLDTWFSSWLWPFATLGWPAASEDLKYFYPTKSLFTASEIIFFWVARMIMAGYHFMGQAPFTQVYIHGTVRDAKGRKMSKSLGNALDPLEIIAEYGADALRFSLIINSGQDIYISKEKFEIGRNFANKIWNAARLVLSNINDEQVLQTYENIKVAELDLPSRWIIGRLNETVTQVSKCVETFQFSQAETLVQDFFWGDYCDWYLELTKAKFNDPATQRCALFVLDRALRLIHPFMPFVTEEIFSYINKKQVPLALSAWPILDASLVDIKAQASMQMVIDAVGAVRSIRTQWNIKPAEPLELIIQAEENNISVFRNNEGDISRLARLGQVNLTTSHQQYKDAAVMLITGARIIVPLKGIVDLDAERRRLHVDLEQKIKNIESLNSRLSNAAFVAKAPEDVITKEKERLATLNKESEQIKAILANISS